MRAFVTNQGVVVPSNFFKGIKEVDISLKEDRIVIVPIHKDDPILKLGKNPIILDIKDASENVDNYI